MTQLSALIFKQTEDENDGRNSVCLSPTALVVKGRKNRFLTVDSLIKPPLEDDEIRQCKRGCKMCCDYCFESLRTVVLDPDEGGNCRQRWGFSLIEVIVVVVIIAIAAMVAVPMFSSAGSIQVKSAANIIAADLEYAKSMAITRGQNYSVIFDGTAESYRIVDQNSNTIAHPVKKGFDYIVNFKSDSRLSRVDITSAQFQPGPSDTITFDYLGSPYSGTGVTNPLNSGQIKIGADGMILTISIEPVTGFISITN